MRSRDWDMKLFFLINFFFYVATRVCNMASILDSPQYIRKLEIIFLGNTQNSCISNTKMKKRNDEIQKAYKKCLRKLRNSRNILNLGNEIIIM